MKVSVDLKEGRVIVSMESAAGIITNTSMNVKGAKALGTAMLDAVDTLQKIKEQERGQN